MKRDIRISTIRMICTLSIVILHIFQRISGLNSAFHIVTDWLNLGLVMFFCISAYLYSNREIKDKVNWYIHRYTEIVISSLIVGIITIIVFTLNGTINSTKIIGCLMSCIGLQVYATNSWMFVQLWFLTYILFFYLTLPFIQKISCKKTSTIKFWSVMIISVISSQILSILIERSIGITLLSTGILLRLYLPYFVFKRYDINGNEIKPFIYLCTVISAISIPIICILRYTDLIGIPKNIVELIFIYVQTLAGFTLFYWLYRFFAFVKSYNIILKLSDKYSYEIYLTHCLFIGYSTSLIFKFNNIFLGIAVSLLATFISSIIVNYLSGIAKKPFKKLINR